MAEVHFPSPHDKDPDIFGDALSYSEGVTGFTANLIELSGRKDLNCHPKTAGLVVSVDAIVRQSWRCFLGER